MYWQVTANQRCLGGKKVQSCRVESHLIFVFYSTNWTDLEGLGIPGIAQFTSSPFRLEVDYFSFLDKMGGCLHVSLIYVSVIAVHFIIFLYIFVYHIIRCSDSRRRVKEFETLLRLGQSKALNQILFRGSSEISKLWPTIDASKKHSKTNKQTNKNKQETNKQKRKIRHVRQKTFTYMPSYNVKLYTTTFFDFCVVLIQQSRNAIAKGFTVYTKFHKDGWCGQSALSEKNIVLIYL